MCFFSAISIESSSEDKPPKKALKTSQRKTANKKPTIIESQSEGDSIEIDSD